jgi:hypothetical protein
MGGEPVSTRRSFLGAILAAAAAPAIVKAELIMPVRKILAPPDPVAELRKVGAMSIISTVGLKVGDVITIAGVAGCHALQQFIVTQEETSSMFIVQAMA